MKITFGVHRYDQAERLARTVSKTDQRKLFHLNKHRQYINSRINTEIQHQACLSQGEDGDHFLSLFTSFFFYSFYQYIDFMMVIKNILGDGSIILSMGEILSQRLGCAKYELQTSWTLLQLRQRMNDMFAKLNRYQIKKCR